MFVVIVIWCSILLVVWSWIRPRPHSPSMYPGALPLIGHVHLFVGDNIHLWNMCKKLLHFTKENGGVSQFKVSLHTVYVSTNPDESLVIANTCLGKPYLSEFLKRVACNGLGVSEVSTWKTQRKLLNPSFNQQVLNTFLNEINIQARILVSQLSSEVENKSFDARWYLINFIMRSVSRILLGLETGNQVLIDKGYVETMEEILEVYIERAQKVWWHLPCLYYWSPLKREEEKLVKKLNDIVDPVISKRRYIFNKSKNEACDNFQQQENFTPLLDHMFDLVDKNNDFNENDVRDHVHNFIFGAYDTMSVTLKYVLLLLGSYPDVQEKVFRELQEVFGDKDVDCTKYNLPKLMYLEAVMKETLRLYPAAPIIGRNIDTDVKLKNCTLRAGSTCILGLYGINRHPIWGADAEQFRPERWLDPATLPDNSNAFATFSLGRRNCIGKVFAMMAMKTALAHVLRRYHVNGDINNVVFRFNLVLQAVEGDLISLTLRA